MKSSCRRYTPQHYFYVAHIDQVPLGEIRALGIKEAHRIAAQRWPGVEYALHVCTWVSRELHVAARRLELGRKAAA